MTLSREKAQSRDTGGGKHSSLAGWSVSFGKVGSDWRPWMVGEGRYAANVSFREDATKRKF